MQATSELTRPMREKRPGMRTDWKLLGWSAPGNGTLAESFWQMGSIRVISSLIVAELPDGKGNGPQWHVSVSTGGKRPLARHVERALRAFGMVGTEEDNHHPGVARHFFQPCDPAHRVDCQCKQDEVTVVEPDGYRWTNPHERADCRGCELQRTLGKPCTIHAPSIARGPASSRAPGLHASAKVDAALRIADALTGHVPSDAGAVMASLVRMSELARISEVKDAEFADGTFRDWEPATGDGR